MARQPSELEQPLRKHLRALFISIVLAIFFISFFNLIGAVITYVIGVSGVTLFGWIVGGIVAGYSLFSGLVKATLTFLMNCAERLADGIADGYYDTPAAI